MDKDTNKYLTKVILKKIMHIESISDDDLRETVLKILTHLNISFDDSDIETIFKDIKSYYEQTDSLSDDDYILGYDFELETFLSSLDSVKIDLDDLFSNWDEILVSKNIEGYKKDIYDDLTSLIEEIYSRREELGDLS